MTTPNQTIRRTRSLYRVALIIVPLAAAAGLANAGSFHTGSEHVRRHSPASVPAPINRFALARRFSEPTVARRNLRTRVNPLELARRFSEPSR